MCCVIITQISSPFSSLVLPLRCSVLCLYLPVVVFSKLVLVALLPSMSSNLSKKDIYAGIPLVSTSLRLLLSSISELKEIPDPPNSGLPSTRELSDGLTKTRLPAVKLESPITELPTTTLLFTGLKHSPRRTRNSLLSPKTSVLTRLRSSVSSTDAREVLWTSVATTT